MAAISSVETILEAPGRSSAPESAKDASARAASEASVAGSATVSGSTSSSFLETGNEPAMLVNANAIPPPLDSVNMMPGVFPGYMSQRVVFSAERPQTPPWPGDASFRPEAFDEEGDSANTTDDSDVAHSRQRRSSSVSDLEEVCESTSRWMVKKWGTDMYGQNVTILSEIMTAGNIQVTQWFYETACARPHGVQKCLGIDNNNYDSLCLTKSAWVYAMIRTARGEEGWTWIAISSSCNCAVRRLSLLEQIGRRSRLTRLEGFR
ncbi:neurotrophin-4-like [Lytechinus pictus]|uniref:neurotrophin-4-like n=1 Tax=Lytechinus pictus TaxID=7653 RepID=UPI0030B9F5CE